MAPTAVLPWRHRIVLLVLAGASVATYPFAVFTPDTARDLEAALRIVSGDAFPLQGGVVGGALHFGPVWFYVLAAALAAVPSLAGVSLVVGALAATKYLFAYFVGRTLRGPRTGFHVALAVAIPGTAALDGITWSHANLIAATSWLTLWCAALAARHDDPRLTLATGAALAVAVHAHPTAIVLAPVLLAQIAARRSAGGGALAALAGAALLAALPFAIAWWTSDTRVFAGGMAAYAQAQGPSGTLGIVSAMATGVAERAFGAFLHRGAQPTRLEIALLWATWGACALGVLRLLARRDRLGWVALGGLVLALAGIALVASMRAFTPYYMAVAPWCGVVLAAGLGLDALSRGSLPLRVLAAAAAVAIIALHAALVAGTIERTGEGWLHTPLNAVSDLKTMTGGARDEPVVPALTRDALARALCADTTAVSLHGEFATALDLTFAEETRLACGSRDRATLGGTDAARTHWVGLPSRAAAALGIAPTRRVGSYLVATPDTLLGPGIAHGVADGDHYPPHDFAGMPLRPLKLSWRAPADRAVLLTNPLPWYLPLADVSLRRDGVLLEPRFVTSSLIGWHCGGCGGDEAAWTLELRTADPSWIDVVTLR